MPDHSLRSSLRAAWLRVPSGGRLWLGTGALLAVAWINMYGKLWCFEKFDAHRFTSRALLSGTLQLRSLVTLAGHDEQVYSGAVYTNWGFGVPVLQAPFHALAGALGLMHGFFPDRAIYFLYLAAAMPVFVAAFDRLLAMRRPPGTSVEQRQLVAWLAVWLVLNWALFPFMSTRFVVFEETLAYMTICELAALGAYVFALRSWGAGPVALMGLAAGFGLLVRSTGLLYAGVWGALVALQRRPKRTAQFAATVAPFVAVFLYSNWVRTGSMIGLGYGNSNPSWAYEMPILRFGSRCADTPVHALQATLRLFGAFFFYIWRKSDSAWLTSCHFDLEERDGARDPYFGPAVLVLLVGLVAGLVKRRERRLELWVPYVAMAIFVAAFVRRGDGFAWRYVGDFWPLIVLASVQYVHTMPAEAVKPLDGRLAKILFWGGFIALARFLVPWEWSSGGPNGEGRADILWPRDTARMEADFRASHAGVDTPLPPRISCGDPLPPLFNNGLGWKPSCEVDTFTNVYLGVPRKDGDHYVLRVRTDGMVRPEVKAYVNGTIYTARRQGDAYEADVVIHQAALTSPIVVATVHWTESEPPGGKLLSVELG
jgi:hypothetical protein